jgi:hypothetical protein
MLGFQMNLFRRNAIGSASMQLNCPFCGHAIPAADINLERLVAKCASCSAVFGFEDQLADAPKGARRLDVPLPKGILVEQQGDGLAITRRWFSPKFLFLVFFCACWDGFLCFWYSMALSQQVWIMAIFALGHATIGLGLTYYTIAGFVNHTLIRVSASQLDVSHGPLPWLGKKRIDSSSIAQIYCKEHISRSRNGTTTSYQVHAATHAGVQERLVDALDSSDQALYLEQEVERFLNIKDAPVVGEMRW